MINLYDQKAEESVLGSMLLRRESVIEAMDICQASDFYNPTHARIFSAIEELLSEGKTVDFTTVGAKVGGQDTFERLMAMTIDTPTASATSTYAKIVYDRAVSRSVVRDLESAREKILAGEDPYQTTEDLDKQLGTIGSAHTDELESVTLDELEASVDMNQDVVIPGMLNRGWRTIIVGSEGSGKALDVDTPLLTTIGWKTMGTVEVGDVVFGEDGGMTKVVAVTEPFIGDCYEVVFSDKSRIVADANHLWKTETLKSREASAYRRRRTDWRTQLHKRKEFPSIKTTKEIFETLMAREGHAVNHSVEVCSPLQLPDADLPLDPYVLGAWLGDGTSKEPHVTSMDYEIINHIVNAGFPVKSLDRKPNNMAATYRFGKELTLRLRETGVMGSHYKHLDIGHKHIPEQYKFSSFEQRLALLQGLMDTDGTISSGGEKNGRGYGTSDCVFSVVNKTLAYDVFDLAIGLGIKASINEGDAKLYGRIVSKVYDVIFQTDLPICRLKRKFERLHPLRTYRARLRYIKECNPVDPRMVRCIQVDREDGMFLAGRTLIPTHNSVLLRTIGVSSSQGLHPFSHRPIPPIRVLIVDLENPKEAIVETGSKLMRYVKPFSPDYDPTRFKVFRRPGGIDLRKSKDKADLRREIDAHKPDLVCIGPVIKMYQRKGGESYEESADAAMYELDQLRVRYGFALMLEHHAAKGHQGSREMTPFGSQRWMSWPEAGKSLYSSKDDPTVVRVDTFRGDRLQGISWPSTIHRDNDWIVSGRWENGIPEGIGQPGRRP